MSISADVALARLREGNERFAAGQLTLSINGTDRSKIVSGQDPFAVVLGCSDSRVPIELVFDQGLGDLFVIRVAGNIVAPSQIGSTEFAAKKFGVGLVVVLGHTRCGAIEATLEELQRPDDRQSQSIAAIVGRIKPSLQELIRKDEQMDQHELARRAVRENVRYSVAALRHGSTVIEQLIEDGQLTIVGAEYALETGIVDFFDGV